MATSAASDVLFRVAVAVWAIAIVLILWTVYLSATRKRPVCYTRKRRKYYIGRLNEAQPFKWTDPEAASATIDTLLALGFEPAGLYVLPSRYPRTRWPRVAGFFYKDARAYAFVSESPSHEVEVDLYCSFADGGSVLYSTSRADREIEYWPSHRTQIRPRADLPSLYTRFMLDLPREIERLPATAESFRRVYDLHLAKLRVWMAGSAGLDRNVKRREELLKALGERPSDRSLESLRKEAAREGLRRLSFLLLRQFSVEQDWPPDQVSSRIKRLRAVHDLMDPDDAVALIFGWRAWLSPRAQAALSRPTGDSPRQIFAQLNATLPGRRRWRKIGVIAGPIAADVYER